MAEDWIAKRRKLLAAATEGPWSQDADDPGLVWGEQRSDGDGYWSLFASETGHDAAAQPSDAALIADARTSLPLALDALEAVLALARRSPDESSISGNDIRRAIEGKLGPVRVSGLRGRDFSTRELSSDVARSARDKQSPS